MRLRLTIVLTVCLLGISVVRAQAQDCEIDVTDSVLRLLEAQSAAANGDTTTALEQIAQTRAALAELVEGCNAAGIEAGVLLDNEFVAPNGTFAVNYPSSWVAGAFSPNPNGGGIFFGSSPTAAAALNSADPRLQPGEQALAVAVGSPAMLGSASQGAAFEDVVRAFAEGSMAQFEVVSELEITTVDDRQIGRAQYRGESFDALLVGIQLPDSDLYAAVVGVSAPGELDPLRPIIEAVALSLR